MSEYQYYEFAAVDQPLNPTQKKELRALSTRAAITERSFVNEYHWGDLKGDPMEWMQRYFDAHVYSSNWGDCRLLLRVPAEVLDPAMVEACTADDPFAFVANNSGDVCVLDWSLSDDSDEKERFWSRSDGPGWMARLLPLRAEIAAGDTRPLYLGWLARIRHGEYNDNTVEPPLPAGLANLSAAQQALAEFLELDPDLLSAAAAASAPDRTASAAEIEGWLDELPQPLLRATARLLLTGQAVAAERKMRHAFQSWRGTVSAERAAPARRCVQEIFQDMEAVRAKRLRTEGQRAAAAERKRQALRNEQLTALAATHQLIWMQIDSLLLRSSGASYDQALQLTRDLEEGMRHAGRAAEFRAGLVTLLSTHGKRRAWVDRLKEAGLMPLLPATR